MHLDLVEIVEVGARNTWPQISRIRAHCSVEMTLDKCVQRLRKRISLENYNKHVADAEAHGLDRTPSFYTSRSIVNLSGLSVSDPLPRLSGKGIGKVKGKNRNYDSKSSMYSDTNSAGAGAIKDSTSAEAFPLDFDEEDFAKTEYTVPLKGGMPLEFSSDSVLLTRSSSDDVKEKEKDLSVHKTTNMANLYYKKGSGKSEDSLNSK